MAIAKRKNCSKKCLDFQSDYKEVGNRLKVAVQFQRVQERKRK